MSSSNSDKNKRGMSLQNDLEKMVSLCKDLHYIADYTKNYGIGETGYKNQKQFKAPYLLTFADGDQWVVFSTTSLRDRIKEQQWDSYFLKKNNASIKKALLVYPDSIDDVELKKFVIKNKKIQEKEEFSSLDTLLSQEEFFNFVEKNALASYSIASQIDKKGKNFEDRIATILSSASNLEKWKSQDAVQDGLHYHIFEKIVTMFGLDRSKVQFIESTADPSIIGYLPSGGQAKTDVLTEVCYKDQTNQFFTISCKRTDKDSVTVHQYSADTFADVLEPSNDELRRVLNEFQRYGNMKDMNPLDVEILTQQIQPHIFKLCMWALGGFEGEGNPEKQWANYLLTYDNANAYSLHTVKEYAKSLSEGMGGMRSFGTPFSWTYQGKRGKSIQLKCPLKLKNKAV